MTPTFWSTIFKLKEGENIILGSLSIKSLHFDSNQFLLVSS